MMRGSGPDTLGGRGLPESRSYRAAPIVHAPRLGDGFNAGYLVGEAIILFDHAAAQSYFGASVFWMRRLAAFGGEQAAVEFWQTKRDGGLRGIVEVLPESP